MALPELVMFDLDGTLVDSVPDLSHAIDEVLLEQGYPAAGEYKARMWVGNGAPMLVRRALADALRESEDAVSEPLHAQCLERFFQSYNAINGEYSELFEGVESALNLLRQLEIPMVIVTNKPARFVPALLRRMGIEDYFDSILGGDSLALKKPDPAPLKHMLSTYAVPASKAIMVGDSINDIEAAKRAGIPCVAVAYGYNRGRPVELDNPDWFTDNLADFFNRYLAVEKIP